VFLARALARQLRHAGHTCRTATSVEAAVDLVAVQPPSVVITDLDLGGDADGVDLACWLRRTGVGVPVVVITAGGGQQARGGLPRAALDEVGVLAKPFALWRLLAVLDERCPPSGREPDAAAQAKDVWS